MGASSRYRRVFSLFSIFGFLLQFLFSGCASTSTKELDQWFETDPFQSLQDSLVGKKAMVFLGDGSEHTGKIVLINAEVVSWKGLGNPEVSTIETQRVWKIEVRKGSNAGGGAKAGFLFGGSFGAVIGLGSSQGDADFFGGRLGSAAVVGLVLGLVGGVIGWVFGGVSHSIDSYVINPQLAPAASLDGEDHFDSLTNSD